MIEKELEELAIVAAKEVAKQAIPPAINLIKGRLLKKSVKVHLFFNTVFTFYSPISIEDYNSVFVKKISESRTAKNELTIGGLTVGYSISPNVKPTFPVVLGAEFGESVLNEEVLSIYTLIDQIRLFIYPSQEKNMSFEDFEMFVKAFDDFLSEVEFSLRGERKIPLNIVAKHLILETDETEFLRKMPKPIMDESTRTYKSNKRIMITYTKVERLLKYIECIW